MRRSVALLAVMVLLVTFLPWAPAAAETAKDITSSCKFYAGSGRTGDNAFAKCTDRNYRTYWKTNNGEKCYVEVTLPEGQSASGVMVQWFEHPHAWGIQVKDEETGKWYVELLPRSLWQALSIHEALEKAFVNDGYSYDRLVYKIKRNVLMVEVYFHKHRSDNRRLIELSINNHEVKLKRNEKNQ